MDDPDRAAVGDHEHLLARVEAEHIREEVVHAGREVLEGLGIVCAGALAGAPAPVASPKRSSISASSSLPRSRTLARAASDRLARRGPASPQTISAVSRARARSLE